MDGDPQSPLHFLIFPKNKANLIRLSKARIIHEKLLGHMILVAKVCFMYKYVHVCVHMCHVTLQVITLQQLQRKFKGKKLQKKRAYCTTCSQRNAVIGSGLLRQ